MMVKKLSLLLAALCGLFISEPARAACSNYTTYSDGQVLTAASMNALQSNYTSCVNDILNGDTFTGNMSWHSGADALFYSDSGSTKTAEILGDSGQAVLGLRLSGKPIGLNATNATTTNSNDSIKIECGNTACSASNPGFITLNSGATSGDITTFRVSSDVTILLTGAHWGLGGGGDGSDIVHHLYAVDHNGSLGWCVGFRGGYTTIDTSKDSTTPSSVDAADEFLCNIAITSSSNTATEVGWYKTDFDDTGGAAEDLWAVQTGGGEIVGGERYDPGWFYKDSTYTGANLDLGTTNDGAYADVDATNAAITFTVTAPGKYLVEFDFPYQVVGSTNTTVASATNFRLTDSVNNGNPFISNFTIAIAANSGNHQLIQPVHVSHVFDFRTVGSKTVKLQKQNTASTNVNSRRALLAGSGSLYMKAIRVSDF